MVDVHGVAEGPVEAPRRTWPRRRARPRRCGRRRRGRRGWRRPGRPSSRWGPPRRRRRRPGPAPPAGRARAVASLSTVPSAPQHAAVPVVGVLVEAQVGDEHHGVAEGAAQLGQRHLHDAVGIPRARPHGVFVARGPRTGRSRGPPATPDAWPRPRATPPSAGRVRAARRWGRARRPPPARTAAPPDRRRRGWSRPPGGAGPACGAGGACVAPGSRRRRAAAASSASTMTRAYAARCRWITARLPGARRCAANAATSPSALCSAATTRRRIPRPRAASAVTGPMHSHDGRRRRVARRAAA